jgi:hypothetical protein
MNISEIKKEVRKRDLFVDDFVSELEERILEYQAYLYELLKEDIEEDDESLDTLIPALNIKLEKEKELNKLIDWYKSQVSVLVGFSESYFSAFGYESADLSDDVDSHIESFTNNIKSFKSDLKTFMVASVISGLTDRGDRFKEYMIPEKKKGAVYNKLLPSMRDTAINALRYSDTRIAKENELDYAYYVGGLIPESRCFCQQRNDLMWSRGRINDWNDLQWSGKIEGVDVKVALGGYNCRHFLMWVDKETADRYGYDQQYSECE